MIFVLPSIQTLVLSLGLLVVLKQNVVSAQPNGDYIGQRSGEGLFCPMGQAVTGVGSGTQIGSDYYETIRCVTTPDNEFSWYDPDEAGFRSFARIPGAWAYCPANHVAIGRCATSVAYYQRCRDNSNQELACAPISTYVRLDTTKTYTGCVKYGENFSCPDGYAVTGTCQSQSMLDPVCNTEQCSGISGTFVGVQCTLIRGYKYDGVDAVEDTDPPIFNFDGVCKAQTYSLEGQSGRTITEEQTFTKTSSIQTDVATSSTSGESLTKSLSVTATVGAEVGFPKLGLGVEASVSTERGFEYSTTFETSQSYSKELLESLDKSNTVTVEYALQGGLTWTVAVWSAHVTASANYGLQFKQYSPGQISSVLISEDAMIQTTRLDDRTFTLVLNSNNHDESFLKSACGEIATQYMYGTGEFSSITPDGHVSEYVEPGADGTTTTDPDEIVGGVGSGGAKKGCFSGDTIVTVFGSGQVYMKDLQVGDQVYTGTSKDGTALYQSIYSFGHWQQNLPMEYIQLYYNKLSRDYPPLELSPNHLIFLAKDTVSPVPANAVSVGDLLLRYNNGIREEVTVTDIKMITKQGAYLPLTSDGTIVVNDIAASAYVSIQPQAPKILGMIDAAFISEQTVFHWWLSPYRMICAGVSSTLCESDYNEEGIIFWLSFGEWIAEFGEQQPVIVQWAGLVLVGSALAVMAFAEYILGVAGMSMLPLLVGWQLRTLLTKKSNSV